MDAKNKLFMLLQQIGMTDDQYVIHFEHAELNRVNIHRKSRMWQFNLTLTKPLPANVYTIFSQRVNEAFAAIATVKLHITSANPEIDERLLTDYWPFVIEEMSVM